MTAPVSFLVYPKKGERFYFTVRVFHSKSGMRAYHDAMPMPGKRDGSFDAVTCPFADYEDLDALIPKPCIGEILFYRPKTGASIVSHEMTHAALHYARLMGMSLKLDHDDSPSEEALATAIGHLTRQFMMKY
jgi:hypothetical protein